MRRGFSLIEVIVAIAIMIIIAAVITPNFIGALDKARVDRAEDDLDTFNTAIDNFHTVIGKYPASMTHLAVKITQTDNNSCGTAYTKGDVGKWVSPFVTRLIPTTGVPVGIGTTQTALTRQDLGGGNVILYMTVLNVPEQDAYALDSQVDAGDGNGAGTVQWTLGTPGDPVSVKYVTPIAGC